MKKKKIKFIYTKDIGEALRNSLKKQIGDKEYNKFMGFNKKTITIRNKITKLLKENRMDMDIAELTAEKILRLIQNS